MLKLINKIASQTSYSITVFDNNSKTELFTEQIDATMHRGGAKAHSGYTIFNMLEQIKKKEYKNWQKKYAGKK